MSYQQISKPRPCIVEAKAKAKARGLRGQGQGQGQECSRPRPKPQNFVVELSSRSRPVLEDPIPGLLAGAPKNTTGKLSSMQLHDFYQTVASMTEV